MGANKAVKLLKKIVPILLLIILGGIIGILCIIISKLSGVDKLNMFYIIFILISLIVSFILQIILHEAGHLVFGLLSGYEFISFRIFSLTIVKENGKFARKKFNIEGTGGQCLMMPKAENSEECPYILYNLGGVLMNIIIGALCIGVFMLFPVPKLIKIFLMTIAISGIIIFITNGIPMKINGLANDGYNIISIGKDKTIRRCFYLQLKVNGLVYKGMRIKDMPFEWFILPDGVDLNNPIITHIKILEANYYHDKLEFSKAKECYEDLLDNAKNILEIYKYEIQCELLFYEIIGERREGVINRLYTQELKRYIKVTDCYITRKRLMYSYSLLVEKDIEKANKLLEEIEVIKKTYPAKGEIKSEIEIINFISGINVYK